jgi:hypothetical protein
MKLDTIRAWSYLISTHAAAAASLPCACFRTRLQASGALELTADNKLEEMPRGINRTIFNLVKSTRERCSRPLVVACQLLFDICDNRRT